MDYFTKFISKLPGIQRAYIEKYLNRRANSVAKNVLDISKVNNTGDISTSTGNIVGNLNSPTPELVIAPLSPTVANKATYGGNMDEVQYDRLMDAIKIDLNSIFSYSANIDADLSNNEREFKSYIKNANNIINKVEGRLKEYRALLGDTRGYNAASTQNFSEVSGARLVGCDATGGFLSITPASTTTYNTFNDIASIGLTKYPTAGNGIYYATPQEHDVVKNYESGNKSMLQGGTVAPGYWVEVMLVPTSTDNDPCVYTDGDTYTGFTAILTMYFTVNRDINEIYLDPISKHKVYVRKVKYLSGSTWNTLNYKDEDNNELMVVGDSYTGMTLRFPPVNTTGLEITLNVIDYDIVRFILKRENLLKGLIWDEIQDGNYNTMEEKKSSVGTISSSSAEPANRTYDKIVVSDPNFIKPLIIDRDNVSDNSGDTTLGNRAFNTIEQGKIDSIILGDDYGLLADTTMREYILGLYSLAPRYSQFLPSGVYYSHLDTGYDTKNGTLRNIMVESDHTMPGASTVEYFLVTDSGIEIPILPVGTTTYREPTLKTADSSGNIVARITYTPAAGAGNVHALYWDETTQTLKELGSGFSATNKLVTITGATPGVTYIMEYDIDTSTELYEVQIENYKESIGWIHEEVIPEGYKIPLPTTPYIRSSDYSNYNYGNSSTDNLYDPADRWGYSREVQGFYSDKTVLTQDVGDGMWDIRAASTGVAGITNSMFLYATRDTYVISGAPTYHIVTPPAEKYFRVKFTGTGRENNEYSYVWLVQATGIIPGEPLASGLILDNSHLYINGDPLPSWYNTSYLPTALWYDYGNATYNPIELFVDGSKAEDHTDYRSEEQRMMEPYIITNNYQYYLDNSTLYTNVDFDNVSKRRLTTRFRYHTSYIKVKVVLRTNTTSPSYFTPQIDSYTIKFLST